MNTPVIAKASTTKAKDFYFKRKEITTDTWFV
jgi:hypothetical protein